MKNKNVLSALVIVTAVATAAGVAWAGESNGPQIAGVHLLMACAALAFAVQWLVFIPSFILQTEKFYDLTGCLTYLLLLLLAAGFSPSVQFADGLLMLMCAVWAIRLGTFLFWRIQKDGSDRRFNHIKPVFMRFLVAWTLQGLWVFLTLSAVLIAVTSPGAHKLSLFTFVGGGLWLIGLSLEVVADFQKRDFKADPANAGRFIQSGLWAWSRHPNYLGEITLWAGIFICVIPRLHGWQWIGMISPLFVLTLITRISGVPMLEAHADAKWGAEPAYQAYKKATPRLWPWLR